MFKCKRCGKAFETFSDFFNHFVKRDFPYHTPGCQIDIENPVKEKIHREKGVVKLTR